MNINNLEISIEKVNELVSIFSNMGDCNNHVDRFFTYHYCTSNHVFKAKVTENKIHDSCKAFRCSEIELYIIEFLLSSTDDEIKRSRSVEDVIDQFHFIHNCSIDHLDIYKSLIRCSKSGAKSIYIDDSFDWFSFVDFCEELKAHKEDSK